MTVTEGVTPESTRDTTRAQDAGPSEPSSSSDFSSAALELEVRTEACRSNLVSNLLRVVNNGTTPIKLSDISIKYWAYDTSGIDLVSQVRDDGFARDASGATHPVNHVSSSAAQFSPGCGSGAGNEANWEITVSTTDHAELEPGAEWTHLLVTTSLASCAHFSPGTQDWFSGCLAPDAGYAASAHYAVYVGGALVFASSGIDAPSCRSPHGSQLLTAYTLPPASPVVGSVAPTTPVEVNVGLPLQQLADLTALVDQASDPMSPTYRQWVSPSDFLGTYAPPVGDYGALVAWAQAQGFDVATYPNRVGIDILGTAAQIEQAFFVNLIEAQRPDGTTFYEPDRQPSINLMPGVLGMAGLDDYVAPIAYTKQTSPDGQLGATDITNAYLGGTPCATIYGDGQTIGLIEHAGFNFSDITTYGRLFLGSGYQATDFVSVRRPHSSQQPYAVVGNGNADECPLDIEMAIAMAQHANIRVFEVSTLDSALTMISNDQSPNLNQVSTSWLDAATTATQPLLLTLASRGISFFAASGDNGAYEPPADYGTCPADTLYTDKGLSRTGTALAPMKDNRTLSYVTLVGGTDLDTGGDAGVTWSGEHTWVAADAGAALGAGGGGIMPSVTIPSWQSAANPSNDTLSPMYRNAPDVSFVANHLFVVTTNCPSGMNAGSTCPASQLVTGKQHAVSGTSGAAPLWAGFTALMNEYGPNFGIGVGVKAPVGFLNPALYEIGKGQGVVPYGTAFHDIHTDSNTNACLFGYPAVPGYDLATGWGTPTCALITTSTPTVQGVSVGWGTACAVTLSGGVDCWGANDSGQLGDGTQTTRSFPMPVLGNTGFPLTGIASVSVGHGFACALSGGGAVSCWGDDTYLELGDDDDSPRGYVDGASLYAGRVIGLGGGATAVSAGDRSACALTGDGILCWGDDNDGELGDGQSLAIETCGPANGPCSPWPIPLLTIDTSTVGFDSFSQPLNDGTNVAAVGDIASVAVGAGFACAVTAGGTVQCWGNDTSGQLGPGVAGGNSLVPVKVPGLGGVQAVAVGDEFTCALDSMGAVSCWGDNSYDELGNAVVGPFNPTPVVVSTLPRAVALSAGGASACAALVSGGLWCWGDNGFGKLGAGSTASDALPGPVSMTFGVLGGSIASEFSMGEESACAVNNTGAIECWGDDTLGELGSVVPTGSSNIPIPVGALP